MNIDPAVYEVTPTPSTMNGNLPVPWGWGAVFKIVLLLLVGLIPLSALAGLLMWATGTLDATRPPGMSSAPIFAVGMGIYLLIVLGVWLFAVRRANGDWQLVGIHSFANHWLWLLPVLLVVQLGGMAVLNVAVASAVSAGGGEFINPQIEAITGGVTLGVRDLLLLMLLVAVVAPIAEELFFRGLLYPLLRRRGVPFALLSNALLFALIHFIPILIPGLFWIGLVLAWVRERSGSIIPGIILHALQNGLVVWAIYAAL